MQKCCIDWGIVIIQQAYGQQQGYSSYSQPAESAYPPAGNTSGGYSQQAYGSQYGQQPPATGKYIVLSEALYLTEL